MEAPDRDKNESKLAAALLTLWLAVKDLDLLLASAWPVFLAAFDRLVAPYLLRLYLAARDNVAEDLGFQIHEQRVPRPDAGHPAKVQELAREIFESFRRRRISEQELRSRGEDPTPAQVMEKWQADSAAVGLVTDMTSRSELDVIREIESRYGVRIISTWFTEPGSCPICTPLHGTTQLWRTRFPKPMNKPRIAVAARLAESPLIATVENAPPSSSTETPS